MPKYENSIIYKLKHNLDYDDENIYIGSTSNFKNRKYCHKKACNNEKNKHHNISVYQYIRDNGGWEEWVMIPIEPYSCYSKKELEIRERFYIDLFKPALNKNIPTRTYKEYYQDNKEKMKEYYENNKEKINERYKEWYQNNRDKRVEKMKEYNQNNSDKRAKCNKEWYQENRDKIAERGKEKIKCNICGFEGRKSDLKRHQRTKKCINSTKD